MMRKLYNLWLRYKTKNFTKIPLFTMVFDYQKFKENGKDKSCVLYAIHPDIATDEFLKGKLQECVDYIRDDFNNSISAFLYGGCVTFQNYRSNNIGFIGIENC